MFIELATLSKAVDFLTSEDAGRIIGIVNAKLSDFLKAHIIDLLWRVEAKNGIILSPYSGACLDRTKRGGPKPFQLRDSSTGLWPWVFENSEPAWIENIRQRDLSKPVKNQIGDKSIGGRYLSFFPETDSVLVVPLEFRDSVRGVYSIELPYSGRINPDIVDMIIEFMPHFATVIWKVDVYNLNRRQTTEVINLFGELINRHDLHLSRYKTGFVARPFDEEFDGVERYISAVIESAGIKAEHYIHPPGGGIVLDEMKTIISDCHFGIVDITGLNYNVLCELGMLLSSNKIVMLIRDHNDEQEIPFDLRGFHYYQYKMQSGSVLEIFNPATARFEDAEPTLRRFIGYLNQDASFHSAKRWISSRR